MIDHDFSIAAGLYFANCVAQAMPLPSGKSELYLFIYRLFHLVLFNIRNVLATAPAKITDMAELPPGITSGTTITTFGTTK